MPNREELRDESVFADHGNNTATVPAAVGGGSHAHSEPRDMTPTGTAAREPFDFSDPNANDVAMEAKNEEGEPSMEEVVSRLIIHEDKPIENLPTMSAPELKLIGRCVSFCLTRTINEEQVVYYYTGLVASVTFTAVTLMHVTRYTRADFKEYVAREKRVTKESGKVEAQSETVATVAAEGMNASATADGSAGPSGLPAHGYTAEGEVGIGNDGGLTGTQDAIALLRMDAAGSLAPAVQLVTGDDTTLPADSSIADTTQAPPTTRAMRRRNFYRCDASIGPLPFATFLRKSLHDVRFGRDPRSSFYNLFHEPLKKMEDMQYLRMFVRRYLVHTAEGNNPRQVPLYAFVTVRCGCPEMDRELVYRVAREELPDLMKADKSIAKEKRKQERQAVQRERTLRAYQAPDGLFSHTGILYVTRLPQITFMTAMLIFVFVIVFAIYLGVSLTVLQDPLMAGYERQLLRYFIPSLIVWAIAGIAVTLHSLYARLPLRTTFVAMVMRCIWSVGAAACAAMVIGVIAQHLKNEKLYAYMSTAKQSDLCGFYNLYGCSGFWVQCSATLDGPCSPYCARLAGLSYSQPCYAYLWNRAQLLLIPLVVFAAMLLCLVLYSVFMLWKLWSTVNHISSRLR